VPMSAVTAEMWRMGLGCGVISPLYTAEGWGWGLAYTWLSDEKYMGGGGAEKSREKVPRGRLSEQRGMAIKRDVPAFAARRVRW